MVSAPVRIVRVWRASQAPTTLNPAPLPAIPGVWRCIDCGRPTDRRQTMQGRAGEAFAYTLTVCDYCAH